MAKVNAPLFSFNASGQLGKSLVYFPWKGIDAVRSYVEPANPNTGAQQTQRGYLTNAVSDWHTIGLIAIDETAWNRYALTLPDPMSGFNAFCRDHINIQVAGLTPDMGFAGTVADDGDGTFTMTINEDGAAVTVDLLWGTSVTALINTEPCTEVVNVWTGDPATNVAGQRIYGRFRIENVTPATIGWSGIYQVDVA